MAQHLITQVANRLVPASNDHSADAIPGNMHTDTINNSSALNTGRSGFAQLALAVALIAFLPFTSEWRLLATAELTGYFVLSGSALVVYASSQRQLPFRKLATTWLPVNPWVLSIFLVLFGSGLAFAEAGHTAVGITFMSVGYGSLGVKSVMRLFTSAPEKSGSTDLS